MAIYISKAGQCSHLLTKSMSFLQIFTYHLPLTLPSTLLFLLSNFLVILITAVLFCKPLLLHPPQITTIMIVIHLHSWLRYPFLLVTNATIETLLLVMSLCYFGIYLLHHYLEIYTIHSFLSLLRFQSSMWLHHDLFLILLNIDIQFRSVLLKNND